jgi:glycogen(starch) synthase
MTTADLSISLIVNTTDRAAPLLTLLRALEHQSYPHFEVVVVVGPTRDNTLEVLLEYEGRVRVLHCPKANLSRSRNIGLLGAHGDVVAFIDDDAVPSRRWLEQLARLFEDPYLDATGGVVYMVHPNRPTVQHRIGIISSLAEQVDVRSSWVDHIVPPGEGSWWVGRMMGTNMAFRRRSLLEIGGFDEFFEWLYDDSDVAFRLTSAGKIVHPVKQAAVYHVPASSRFRVALSYDVKWWLQTKSVFYLSLKNRTVAGEPVRAALSRCLRYVHGHWLWSGQLWRAGRLSLAQCLRMRAEEMRSAVSGTLCGLLRRRRLIDRSLIEPMLKLEQPIQRFQDDESAKQPTVDPVSGDQPALSPLPDPPLRICLLSSAYPPAQYEGVGRHTNLMAKGLFECGHSVHVITRGEKEEVAFYDGAYVHKVAFGPGRYDRYLSLSKLYHSLNHSHAVYDKVKQLILNDGIQVVDSPVWMLDGLVTAVSGIAPVVVRPQTALRQIAALQHDHDTDARLVGELERALIERAAYLVPNSQATLEALKEVYGVRPAEARYAVVPHGIVPVSDEDVRPFDTTRAPDTFTVLYVGRLEKRKGILDLFQAIPLVMKQIPNARFVIAGGDNSAPDGFQRRTGMDYPTHFTHRYPKLVPHVEFMGRVSDDTLQSLYQSCDLFVAPSLYESFGLIYLEAMNYAKPAIGCQAGGIPEVVDHGVTGLLVEPQAPAAVAEAIVSLLKSPIKLREMGVAGRQRLLEEFTHIQMARNFERVYRAVIQNSSGGPQWTEQDGGAQ